MFLRRYKSEKDFYHVKSECTGILLVNLGTPDQPETPAVKRYLGEFLSDPRVVELPRILWLTLLHGVILRRRSPRTANLYRSIWLDEGSPLLVYSQRLCDGVSSALKRRFRGPVKAELAMRYGSPSIASALEKLNSQGARRLLVVPLYPQYSATTTATVFDAVSKELSNWRWIPEVRFVNQYHDYDAYIDALANRVDAHWREKGRGELLLMSFHGLPQRNLHLGDPYHCQCYKTGRLVAEKLKLADDQWKLTFQSRFGKAQWLQPYTDKTLEQLPENGISRVDVICPGFAADCLETLEEINVENKEIFIGAGGSEYHYIPALNDGADHVELIMSLIANHAQGWFETSDSWDASTVEKAGIEAQARAKQLGAKL